MDDLDALLENQPIAPPTLAGASTERKCRRHVWIEQYGDGRVFEGYFCGTCGKAKDQALVSRNRKSRSRGNRTSRDLADYLGIQNVEALKLPWDVQANHLRIQSKRQGLPLGPVAQYRLIDYIPAGDWLRGVFIVAPRARLTNGTVTVLLQEWVDVYGWYLPPQARLATAGPDALLSMMLPVFAGYVGQERAA